MRGVPLVLVVASLSIVSASCDSLHDTSSHHDQAGQEKSFGDTIPDIAITDLGGHTLSTADLRGHVALVEFVTLDPIQPTCTALAYTNLLARTYRDRGLLSLCVINEDSPALKAARRLSQRLGEVVFVADNAPLNEAFAVQPNQAATFLVGPSGVIRFAQDYSLLSNDQKRQLTERFVLGAPRFALEGMNTLTHLFAIHHSAPDLILREATTGTEMTLLELTREHPFCLLFSSSCSTCEARNYRDSVWSLQRRVKAYGETLALIFAAVKEMDDVRMILSDPDSENLFFSIENPDTLLLQYDTRGASLAAPMALAFSKDGVLLERVALDDFGRDSEKKFEELFGKVEETRY